MFLDPDEVADFAADSRRLALTTLYTHGVRPHRCMTRDDDTGRCAALVGPLGDCGCAIYERRPRLCRAFEAGSPECLRARRMAGVVG